MNTHKYLLPFTVFSACYIEAGHIFTFKLYIFKEIMAYIYMFWDQSFTY